MRHRKVAHKEEKIEAAKSFIAQQPLLQKGNWHELFGNDAPIHLEIGSGKGMFITTLAARNCGINYLACEGLDEVYVRILEKITQNELNNVRLIASYMDDASDFFEPGEIDRIYLNFCDPWKKGRQAKRRLTYKDKLEAYIKILGPGKLIEFKTDNDDLFEFSLHEAEICNLKTAVTTRDLQHSRFASENIQTEYEQKFTELGKNINYAVFETR